MAKQLDLNILNIISRRDEEREEELGEGFVYYRRSIERSDNEDGKTRRIIAELEEMGKEFSIEFEKILELYGQVSGCKMTLRHMLEKKTYTTWSELED